MTAPALAAPGTAVTVLEARGLTKHFQVHGLTPGSGRRLPRIGRPGPVVYAVDDVTLALPAGRVTAVLGESEDRQVDAGAAARQADHADLGGSAAQRPRGGPQPAAAT